MRDFAVTDFGAAADGVTNDANAIQRAVDAAHAAGGGRVVIPRGCRVRAGHFTLRSRVELHVAEGAVLLSATEIEAFPQRVFGSGDEAEKRVWIGARHASDITLSGGGAIDGQCRAFALGETPEIYTPTLPWRPAMTCFEDCERVTVRDLLLRDSANWTLHFTGCRDVLVRDVRIWNDLRFPNADGIDPDHCKRVRIERCEIVSADDGIVLKNTAAFAGYGDCEEIEVSDCRIVSASAALKIGSESHGDFRRIRVRDCVIERSNRGIAVQLRDGGSLSGTVFERIRVETRRYAPVFWGAGEPVCLTALPRTAGSSCGRIEDVVFRDLYCRGENGIVLCALPPGEIRRAEFRDVAVELRDSPRGAPDAIDLRPFDGGSLPEGFEPASEPAPWGCLLRHEPTALFTRGVEEIALEGIRWRVRDGSRTAWRGLPGRD